jgi:hypothetical protein
MTSANTSTSLTSKGVNEVQSTNFTPSAPIADQLWNATIGGDQYEKIKAISNCSDGGYILAGETASYGAISGDGWLVKLDSSFYHQWNKTYGDIGGDWFYDVIECSTGGYAAVGSTNGYGVDAYDMWLVRVDSSGNHLWNKTFGYTDWDEGLSIVETAGNGFLISGYRDNSKDWSIWIDSSGNHIQNKTYLPAASVSFIRNTISCRDGGFLSVGSESGNSWAWRLDSDGNQIWNTSIVSTYARSVTETMSGDFAIACITGGDTGLVKLSSSGSISWTRAYDIGAAHEGVSSIFEHSTGGYVIAGTYGAPPTEMAFLFRTDELGNEIWSGFPENIRSAGEEIIEVYDSSIVTVGYSQLQNTSKPNGWIQSMSDFRWDSSPSTVYVERGTGFTFDANTTADVHVDSWWLNDTLLEVDSNGVINNPSLFPIGIHNFTLSVNDTLDRTLMVEFTLDVDDQTAPQWVESPQDQQYQFGDPFIYDLDTTDVSGITSWWISDTTHFNMSWGRIQNKYDIPLGVYPLTVNVSDSVGNHVSESFTVTVVDTTSPMLNVHDDVEIAHGTTGNWINWTCSDLLPATYNISVNGVVTESGEWDGDGVEYKIDGFLPGSYGIILKLNDTSGNYNADDLTLIVNDETSPVIDDVTSIWYLEGVDGNTITWNPFELFPDYYYIYMDGIIVDEGEWYGGEISVTVDGLEPGSHNCTLKVLDETGNWATDSVLVVVIQLPESSTSTAITTTTDTTSTINITEYLEGLEGSFTLGLLLVGGLAGVAIIVGVINIIMIRSSKKGL